MTTNDTRPVILVTGSTNGIGRETVIELARRGARVVAHGRDRARLQDTLDAIRRVREDAALEPVLLDLSRLDEVRGAAAELGRRTLPVEVLVNNAGVRMREKKATPDGFETTFAVNHLAPFALTHALLNAPNGAVLRRIVNVSSIEHTRGVLDFDDLGFDRRTFDSNAAYAASKLAMVLSTVELARRTRARGVVANSLHPGVGARGRDSLARAAASSVKLALDEAGRTSGGYFVDGAPAPMSPAVMDSGRVRRLYELSAELAQVEPFFG